MNIAVCLADNVLCPYLLNQTGNLQTVLKVVSDTDKTDIEVADSQALKHGLIGTVSNLGADHIWKDGLQLLL
jgi:hypothetical protein